MNGFFFIISFHFWSPQDTRYWKIFQKNINFSLLGQMSNIVSALSCQITFLLCFSQVYISPKKLPHHEGQSGGWLTYFFGKKQRTSVSLSFPIRIFFTIPAPPTPLLNDNGKCWSRFALFYLVLEKNVRIFWHRVDISTQM